MIYDIQKANLLKRFSAFLLDVILLAVVSTGIIWLISEITGYDNYSQKYEASLKEYETLYNIKFEEYEELSEDEQVRYKDAYNALIADKEAMKNYSMTVNLTFVMISLGLFISFLICEFIIPLIFKNGQTVGKKIFGICVIRIDGVRIPNSILFVRSILGKYTIETMVPLLLAVMFFFGIVDPLIALAGIIGILASDLIMLIGSKKRQLLHDTLASTVVVDKETQMIFDSVGQMNEYKQRIHKEMVDRSDY